MQSTAHNLVDLAEAQRSSQTSRDALHTRGPPASGFPADFLNGRFQSFRRETNGVRKRRMQNQELGDALRLHVRGVRLAIGLEGRAGAQQSDLSLIHISEPTR